MRQTFLYLLTILSVASPAWSAELTLQNYLDIVKGKNESYQGASAQAIGSQGLAREADLIFTPELFAEAKTGYDEKLSRPSFFEYDGTDTTTYSLGISQKTRFGLEAKLSYLMTDMKFNGAESVLGSNTEFADGAAQLELSMPLWKNGFGRTNRANEDVTREQANANRFQALYQSANILVKAESAYWRLSAATEQLKIEEQTLKAAQNIQDYVIKKSKKDLGETADVLQATALVEAYNLQVQQAQTELRSAQREFNLYLNRDATEAVPNLEGLNFSALEGIQVPSQRPGDRPDVKASEAQAKAAKASSTLAVERNKPKLDLYGGYSAYGQTATVSDAFSDSMKAKRDGAYVGVRFSVPLGVSAQSDAKEGAYQTQIAAEKNLSYLKYSQEQEWIDLIQKMTDAKQTLKLAAAMEKAQKAKLDNERTRLRQGRTTTYQVLQFEQEYNKAQVSRIQAASKILGLNSQTKLYQENLKGGE